MWDIFNSTFFFTYSSGSTVTARLKKKIKTKWKFNGVPDQTILFFPYVFSWKYKKKKQHEIRVRLFTNVSFLYVQAFNWESELFILSFSIQKRTLFSFFSDYFYSPDVFWVGKKVNRGIYRQNNVKWNKII